VSDPRTEEAPELSLILPSYNEAARLPRTLERVAAYFDTACPSAEIIVVDDGSSDETSLVASEALVGRAGGQVVTFAENRGKGAAVRAGVLAARGQRVLFSDADLSSPIEEEARLRAALDRGADVAIGSRAEPDSRITVRQGTVRQSMGRTFNLLARLLGLTSFRDTQCGFKMFTLEAARAIFPVARLEGFAFDVEVLHLAERSGFRVVAVPIEWQNDPVSRVRMVRDSLGMIFELLRIRLRYAPWGARGTIRAASASRSSSATERSRDRPGGPA
jgi:dolichyl-phosphate beta-glucosyltransferase